MNKLPDGLITAVLEGFAVSGCHQNRQTLEVKLSGVRHVRQDTGYIILGQFRSQFFPELFQHLSCLAPGWSRIVML